MTKTYTFYGSSDDLIEVSRSGGLDEEFNVPEGGTFRLRRPSGEGVRIYLSYVGGGTWMAGVSPLEDVEDGSEPWPQGWSFLLNGPSPGALAPVYTAVLTVGLVDDDAALTADFDPGWTEP